MNILDDLRLVRLAAPDVPAGDLFELITTRAADALQLQTEIGSIAPGKAADLVAFRAIGEDPLDALLNEPLLPTHLWIDGRLMLPRRADDPPAWRA